MLQRWADVLQSSFQLLLEQMMCEPGYDTEIAVEKNTLGALQVTVVPSYQVARFTHQL
jgi:hypothetical protein